MIKTAIFSGKKYLKGSGSFRTKVEVQKRAKEFRVLYNQYVIIDKNKDGWFIWQRSKLKTKSTKRLKVEYKNLKKVEKNKDIYTKHKVDIEYKPLENRVKKVLSKLKLKNTYKIDAVVYSSSDELIKRIGYADAQTLIYKGNKLRLFVTKGTREAVIAHEFSHFIWDENSIQILSEYSKFKTRKSEFSLEERFARDSEAVYKDINKNRLSDTKAKKYIRERFFKE